MALSSLGRSKVKGSEEIPQREDIYIESRLEWTVDYGGDGWFQLPED